MKIVLIANSDWYLYNFRRSFILTLKDASNEVLLISPPGPYSAKFEELGVRWMPVPMERKNLNPWHELSLIFSLRRLFRREKPDLVHGFTIKGAVYGLLAARLAGVSARVGAVAGLGYVFSGSGARKRVLQPLVKTLMRIAFGGKKSALIFQNPDDMTLLLRERVIDSAQAHLIRGSGVDCEEFAPPENRRLLDGTTRMRVLMASRLLVEKGVREYVAAAIKVKRVDQNVDFLLAGEPDPGNPASISQSEVNQWIETNAIRWLGHVERMPDLMRSVDVFVLPSYYGEGLPKSLIEAAACGLCLVTTDMPGCREVVTHEVDGLLVKVKDSDSLACAIDRLSSDRDMVSQLGRAARAKALDEFDHRIVIRDTLEVYQDVLDYR